jgi:hypothetical protein
MSKGLLSLLILTFLLTASTGCGGQAAPISASGFFPKSGAIPGWSTTDDLMTYTSQNLFDLVDGQSETFFAYAFEKVSVQRYLDSQGHRLSIEIWQLAGENDAYGLFTASRAGSPVNIGNQGDADPGRRLIYWQNRYYVHINANQDLPDDVIMTFGKAVSSALPTGGTPPDLVKQLPRQDLEPGSEIFFHQEISIQSEVWLGGSNLLGLGPATNGVIARYMVNGQPGHLLLIAFTSEEKASSAMKALQDSQTAGLIASARNKRILGAVFGSLDQKSALELLDRGIAL